MSILARASRQRLSVVATVVAILAAACTDSGPTPQKLGTIRVSVESSGGDLDADGYMVEIDSGPQRLLTAADQLFGKSIMQVRLAVSPGPHSVVLTGVDDNCSLAGTESRPVTVTVGQEVAAAFIVTCFATGVEVTTRTTGPDNPLGFDVLVDQTPTSIAVNGTTTVSRLRPGAHTVSLRLHGDNCTVEGSVQTLVNVPSRTITPVSFAVACHPATRLEKIAFVATAVVNGVQEQWIAVVKPDGSGDTLLTPGNSPAWSPDGKRLVFSADICNAYDDYYGFTCSGGLSMVDPEIGSMTRLSGGDGGFTPAWAPAGDLIAFTRCCQYGDHSKLFLTGADHEAFAQLTIPGVLAVTNPAWSPDGQRIAFTCSDAQSTNVCMIKRDGTEFLRLTTGLSDNHPAWSPDGKRIAFDRSLSTSGTGIFLVTVNDGVVTYLTDGLDPAWSRDGSMVVFTGGNGLFTITIDGLRRTRVTTGAHYEPAWRP